MLLEGLFLPLTTPFYGDGRLYLRKLEHNAERYSRTLAAGLAVLTPSGEPTRLSDEEHRQALKSVAEATARETMLLADITRGGVWGALEAAENAAALDYDVALLRLPPGGDQISLQEQRTFALTVADRSPLPTVLLEERGEALSPELLSSLAEHDQIIGWIAAGSSVTAVSEVLARTRCCAARDHSNPDLYSGDAKDAAATCIPRYRQLHFIRESAGRRDDGAGLASDGDCDPDSHTTRWISGAGRAHGGRAGGVAGRRKGLDAAVRDLRPAGMPRNICCMEGR